ncbi:alpha/beta hydrolase-fold protein [Capnocytophaga leadbetteri]|uniref:alpha/beta hydrolase-fold protein n=1 Tax=Capnocytophaga leadbetteri TaxID=327575 RepID=UPI0038B34274
MYSDRDVVGHSLSGLAAVNALLTHPTLFNVYVAHDPSLWWSESYLKNTARWLRKNRKEAQAKAVLNFEF